MTIQRLGVSSHLLPCAMMLVLLTGMFKNQLQELAQRSCFNLPAYACIREGPDHAPRFKATVNFNGELFESPSYCSTLRQAEHAAAEVALNTLLRRGPSQSLAARILVSFTDFSLFVDGSGHCHHTFVISADGLSSMKRAVIRAFLRM
jgi:hypothetical protein